MTADHRDELILLLQNGGGILCRNRMWQNWDSCNDPI